MSTPCTFTGEDSFSASMKNFSDLVVSKQIPRVNLRLRPISKIDEELQYQNEMDRDGQQKLAELRNYCIEGGCRNRIIDQGLKKDKRI